VSHQVGRKARLNAELHSKHHFKRKRGESERWRRSSAGCERVQALSGEKRAKMLGESDRERNLHTTSSSALAGKYSGESFSIVFEKTRRGFQGPLKTHDLKESENNKTHSFQGLLKRLRLLKPRAQARHPQPSSSPYVTIQHMSPYVSIRHHTSAYFSIRQHTSAFVSIRHHKSNQHTSAYVSIR